MRRTAAVLTTLICAVGALTGCGEDEPSAGTTGPETIEITFSGGSVEPNGERIEVERGQEITLVVKSDEAGELHVHTEPEKELAYDVGTTELKLTIDEPGVVDVEDHHLEVVVVQLEVS
jgi:hypothetical protein